MRLPRSTHDDPPPGVGDPTPESADLPFSGSWAAVRWEYERPDGSGRVDVIGDRGGSITLSIAGAAYVLNAVIPPDGLRSESGRVRTGGEEWVEFAPPAGPPQRIAYRRARGTLVLRSDAAAWDFEDTGEEPAQFTAVLVGL